MAKLQLNESCASGFDAMIWMSIVPSGTPFFMKVRLIECSKLLLWTSKDSSFRYLMEKSRKLKDSSACLRAAATT